MRQRAMTVLLSIKPEFAEKIFDGTKKYEFRKSIFKNADVKTVIIYASSPVQRVIGEFTIDRILNDDLSTIWNETEHHAGITHDFYMSYFANKQKANAIKIRNAKRYAHARRLSDYNIHYAPQSFAYIQ